jgi:hypothetical protein
MRAVYIAVEVTTYAVGLHTQCFYNATDTECNISLLLYVELFLCYVVRELRTASRLHGHRLLHGCACHRGGRVADARIPAETSCSELLVVLP